MPSKTPNKPLETIIKENIQPSKKNRLNRILEPFNEYLVWKIL
ncbi:hypothetical protein CUZ88_2586 [Enterococcus xinjiangensis]|nr:hypothetical protein [Enterococcus lactis]